MFPPRNKKPPLSGMAFIRIIRAVFVGSYYTFAPAYDSAIF